MWLAQVHLWESINWVSDATVLSFSSCCLFLNGQEIRGKQYISECKKLSRKWFHVNINYSCNCITVQVVATSVRVIYTCASRHVRCWKALEYFDETWYNSETLHAHTNARTAHCETPSANSCSLVWCWEREQQIHNHTQDVGFQIPGETPPGWSSEHVTLRSLRTTGPKAQCDMCNIVKELCKKSLAAGVSGVSTNLRPKSTQSFVKAASKRHLNQFLWTQHLLEANNKTAANTKLTYKFYEPVF